MLAARTPLQINKTEGHLTRKPEERRPVCLTDLVCCTGELSGTKASLFMELAWDTSVFIRLIEHKSTSRALNKSKEWRSTMQTKWHMRPSWMRLTFQSKTLTADTPHLASSKYQSFAEKYPRFLSSDMSRPGPDKWQCQHYYYYFFTLQVSLHEMDARESTVSLSSMPLSQENKT